MKQRAYRKANRKGQTTRVRACGCPFSLQRHRGKCPLDNIALQTPSNIETYRMWTEELK